jgi:hypothetical protein
MTYHTVVSKPRWADMADDEDFQVLVNANAEEVLDQVLVNTNAEEVLDQVLVNTGTEEVLVNTDTEEEPAETFQEMEQPTVAQVVYVPYVYWADPLVSTAYEDHCKRLRLMISGHFIALIFHRQDVLKELFSHEIASYERQKQRFESAWEKDFLKKLCEEWKDLLYEMSPFRPTQSYAWNDINSEQTKNILQTWEFSFLNEISYVHRMQSYHNNRPPSLQDGIQCHSIFNQHFTAGTDFKSIEVKPGTVSLCEAFLKEFINQRAVDYIHYGISNVTPFTASFGDENVSVPGDWNKVVVQTAMNYMQSRQYKQWLQATNSYNQPRPPEWQRWRQRPQREPVEQGRPLRPGLQALPLTPGPVQ